jgi:hypothetical protein
MDFVTWSCWLREIIIDFPQTVTWSCWLWLIINDFPQILSLGHVGYGSMIINHNKHDQVTKSEGNH